MDDNVFENSVLLTRYLTLNFFHFCVTQRLIRVDVALYVLLSATQYIFPF